MYCLYFEIMHIMNYNKVTVALSQLLLLTLIINTAIKHTNSTLDKQQDSPHSLSLPQVQETLPV